MNWTISDHGAGSWRELFAVVFVSGVSVVGTSFALYGTTQEFLVIATSRLALDALPASVVASIIWNFGDSSLAASLIIFGVFLSMVTGVVSYLGYEIGSRLVDSRPRLGAVAGSFFIVGGVATPFGESPLSVVVPALAGAVVTMFVLDRERFVGSSETDDTRRTLLRTVAAVAGYNTLTHAIGVLRGRGTGVSSLDISDEEQEAAATTLESARQKSFDIDGMPGLIVDTDEFFNVDINPRPPVVDSENWELTVTGAVGTERTFGYEEIQKRETVHEAQTIRCLGDPVDGTQIGNAVWSGTRLLDLVDEADPQGDHIMLRAVDGYYYSMPMEMAEGAVLAYGMNGETLPRAHGFPVRAAIRNRWGKLNVKWLEEIEVVDEFESGYWEERGWDGMAPVHTVVKIQASNRLSDGAVQLGGHAYAGTRGIQTVEISIDGGETWSEATLAEPLSDPDTWRQWKYEWQPERSSYSVVARAVDGTGARQPRARSDPYPSGATGWTNLQVDIQL